MKSMLFRLWQKSINQGKVRSHKVLKENLEGERKEKKNSNYLSGVTFGLFIFGACFCVADDLSVFILFLGSC